MVGRKGIIKVPRWFKRPRRGRRSCHYQYWISMIRLDLCLVSVGRLSKSEGCGPASNISKCVSMWANCRKRLLSTGRKKLTKVASSAFARYVCEEVLVE